MTPRDAAADAIRRMKSAWPAWSWSLDMEREYGRGLMSVGDVGLIEEGTTRAIREIPGRFPPPLADILVLVERVRMTQLGEHRSGTRNISVDEAALRDAKAALSYARTDDDRAHIEEQIASIRRRLPDRGERHDRQATERFLQADPHPYDRAGVLRFVVLQPDGTRRPQGGRVLGEGRGPTPKTVPGVPQVGVEAPPGVEHGSPYPRGPLSRGRAAA